MCHCSFARQISHIRSTGIQFLIDSRNQHENINDLSCIVVRRIRRQRLGTDRKKRSAQSLSGQGLAIKPGAYSDFVNRNYDGSAYFKKVTIPTLWVNGTNDSHFPMPSTQKSAQAVSGPATLRFELRMNHGHGSGWRPSEIYAFADSIVKDGQPLVRIAKPKIAEGHVTVSFSSASNVTKSELLYTRDKGLWPKRKWETASAIISESTISATVPGSATVVLFNLTDERDLMVSSEFVEVK